MKVCLVLADCVVHLKSINSTSKIKVELGGIKPLPTPREPEK